MEILVSVLQKQQQLDSKLYDIHHLDPGNGHQGNWVRANTIEALCNYQIYTNSSELDAVIEAAWPSIGFEVCLALSPPFPRPPPPTHWYRNTVNILPQTLI